MYTNQHVSHLQHLNMLGTFRAVELVYQGRGTVKRVAPKMRPLTATNLGGVTLVLGIATIGTACSLALEQITQLDQSNMILTSLLEKGLIRLRVSRDCAVRVPLAIDCS